MPDDPKMTTSRPVAPVIATVIGTGDTSRLPSGTLAVTPDVHQPNVVVKVVQPIAAILIRFVNSFLTSLLGIVTGAMVSDVITASDFLHLVYKCAGLAVAGAGMGLLKDLITVFGKLEGKFPLISGGI